MTGGKGRDGSDGGRGKRVCIMYNVDILYNVCVVLLINYISPRPTDLLTARADKDLKELQDYVAPLDRRD